MQQDCQAFFFPEWQFYRKWSWTQSAVGSNPDPASCQHGSLFSHCSVLQLLMSWRLRWYPHHSCSHVPYTTAQAPVVDRCHLPLLNPASTNFTLSLQQGSAASYTLGTLVITQRHCGELLGTHLPPMLLTTHLLPQSSPCFVLFSLTVFFSTPTPSWNPAPHSSFYCNHPVFSDLRSPPTHTHPMTFRKLLDCRNHAQPCHMVFPRPWCIVCAPSGLCSRGPSLGSEFGFKCAGRCGHEDTQSLSVSDLTSLIYNDNRVDLSQSCWD